MKQSLHSILMPSSWQLNPVRMLGAAVNDPLHLSVPLTSKIGLTIGIYDGINQNIP